MRGPILAVVTGLLLGAVAFVAWVPGAPTLLLAALAGSLAALAWRDALQRGDNVRRNFPVLGTLKATAELNRQIWQQAAIEDDREGRPFDLLQRRIVERRASGEAMHTPFGTEYDYQAPGHTWVLHSNHPVEVDPSSLRVRVGGSACRRPYVASVLNVAGMSYGSISPEATRALNLAALRGGFAHNTGEGGLADEHLAGGDLIFQLGTGYFGCRAHDGGFDERAFRQRMERPEIRMIEIKLSQGAKPGYGAILPAKKNTPEIAAIRGLEPWTEVHSPGGHSAFADPRGLVAFVGRLRELADGRPIGVKLCLGHPREWEALVEAMAESEARPDYLCIDGGEGGTGAASLESLHWVGMPLEDALARVHDDLVRAGVRDRVRVFAAGKVISAFDVVRLAALGADGVFSARAMMFALGCTQALKCDTNQCPTGVTTMDPRLRRGLVVEDKATRVARFHRHTVDAVATMLGAAGLHGLHEVRRDHLCRRTEAGRLATFEELFPSAPPAR